MALSISSKYLVNIPKLLSIWVISTCIIYAAWQLVRIFFFDQFITPTDSMIPTLMPGDRILVDKRIFGARIYHKFDFNKDGIELSSHRTRGMKKVMPNDIVVFNFPHHNGKINFVINNVYAKRCIGIPGDSISIKNGYFKNNNYDRQIGLKRSQELLERMSADQFSKDIFTAFPHDSNLSWTIKDFGPLYLPRKGDFIHLTAKEGCLYHMILEWETGKTITYDWERDITLAEGRPLSSHNFKHDYYFMCGDNVSNSNDSRYWGLVPEDYIVGVVSLITYSVNPRNGKYRSDRFLSPVNS